MYRTLHQWLPRPQIRPHCFQSLFLKSALTFPYKHNMSSHTLTGLKRWSCLTRELPRTNILCVILRTLGVFEPWNGFLYRIHIIWLTNCPIAPQQIKAIHIYDFDNTCRSILILKRTMILVNANSVYNSFTKPKVMEWTNNWPLSRTRELCEWWLVARCTNTSCYRGRYQEGGASSVEWVVE